MGRLRRAANAAAAGATARYRARASAAFHDRNRRALRLVGAEYIVFKSAWDGAFPGTTPRLFGQDFHLVPEGNRYGLPSFYALHVWMWQPNRSGMFADWNPSVHCP